jgi:hypothetical protein
MLGLGIERRGWFVEHEGSGRSHETARERELLPLAERNIDAARPCRFELRVEAQAGATRHPRRLRGGQL